MALLSVKVVEFGDRAHYQMQYVDPVTRKKKTRSTGVVKTGLKRDRVEAERVAAKWEAELREGRYCEPGKVTWEEFRRRYEEQYLSGLSAATLEKVDGVFDLIETILNPNALADLTAERISVFTATLRRRRVVGGKTKPPLSESTIAGNLAHLQAALNWAVRMGLLAKAPKIDRPKRAKNSKVMKGRPITTEELERMLGQVAAVVGEQATDGWKHYIRGLWCSGLRLAESLELYWDRDDRLGVVDIDARHPMLKIPGELEKGNTDRLLPMAPEFAELLRQTPPEQRRGHVFKLFTKYRTSRPTEWTVSDVVARIGKAANVKVNTDPRTGKVKFASAHDLRRSFGERWAAKVMPQMLMMLMRHESIDTTMKYYVGRNAKTASQVLWDAYLGSSATGNTSGNSDARKTDTSA